MSLFVRFRRLPIAIASVVLVLVLAIEISGHLLNWPQPYSALFEFDQRTGFRNPVSREIRIKSGERVHHLSFDGNGLLDSAGHEPYVIILGDGVVAGVELQQQERIAHLIVQNGLPGSINLSVTGYGTLQQVLALEGMLQRLSPAGRPHTVILIFNIANDLVDSIRDWDGTMIPGAHLANPREILPPDTPSSTYRVLRKLYLRSYALQGVRGLAEQKTNIKAESFVPCVNSTKQDCELALTTSDEIFKRLHLLAKKNSLSIHGFFWDDLEVKPFPESKVTELMRRIQEMSSFINWHGSLGFGNDGDNDNKHLAPGTRHANAQASRVIAERILKVISVNMPGSGNVH